VERRLEADEALGEERGDAPFAASSPDRSATTVPAQGDDPGAACPVDDEGTERGREQQPITVEFEGWTWQI